MTPIVLLLLGLLLIFIEFYLPGAVMGVSGGIFVLISIIMFAMQTPSPWAILLYIVVVGILLTALIRFALWKIKHTKADRSIYSDDNQHGFKASAFDSTLIGKTGIVVTDLKPGGHILVDGKRVQAISQAGYLVKGTEVQVLSGQEESLIVKKVKKDT